MENTSTTSYVFFNDKLRRIITPTNELYDIFNQIRLFILTDHTERPFVDLPLPALKKYQFQPSNTQEKTKFLNDVSLLVNSYLELKKYPEDVFFVEGIDYGEDFPNSVIFNIIHRGIKKSVEVRLGLFE